jgi:hypothetical protein
MVKILCWLDTEDYWFIHNMHENSKTFDYYAYRFSVDDNSETPDPTPVNLLVIELINAKMAVGFVLPPNYNLEKEFRLGFICQEKPDKDIPLECKLSDEEKKAQYPGSEIDRIEYIGFTLEKFYEQKDVKFYLHDLRPPKQPSE